jgi:hypothetical protein
MKQFIRENLRLNTIITEEMIDGQEMGPALQSLCNTISVNSYHEVLGRIITAIGHPEQNPELWAKIEKPLGMLKQSQTEIDKEKHTNNLGNYTPIPDGMTGDSMADEADTWWAAIQSTLCEQGPEFQ